MVTGINHEIKVPAGMRCTGHRVEGIYMIVTFTALKSKLHTETPRRTYPERWIEHRTERDRLDVYYDNVGRECFKVESVEREQFETHRENRWFPWGK